MVGLCGYILGLNWELTRNCDSGGTKLATLDKLTIKLAIDKIRL